MSGWFNEFHAPLPSVCVKSEGRDPGAKSETVLMRIKHGVPSIGVRRKLQEVRIA